MKRFLFSATVLTIGLLMSGAAQAKGGSGHGSHGSHASHASHGSRGSHVSHGSHGSHYKSGMHSRNHGYRHSYKGRYGHHWRYRCWYGRYGCYCYYAPESCCWYYWYANDDCYYPVSYAASCTPTVSTTTVVKTEIATLPAPPANIPGPDADRGN